jgi:hypothetical protein
MVQKQAWSIKNYGYVGDVLFTVGTVSTTNYPPRIRDGANSLRGSMAGMKE